MKDEYTKANLKLLKTLYNKLTLLHNDREMPDFDDGNENFEWLNINHKFILNSYSNMSLEYLKGIYSLLYKYFTFRFNDTKLYMDNRNAEIYKSLFSEKRVAIKESYVAESYEKLNYNTFVSMEDVEYALQNKDLVSWELVLLHIILNGALRTSFYDKLIIVTRKEDIPTNQNYLYVNARQTYYYVHNDKVSNTKTFAQEKYKKIIIYNPLKSILINYAKDRNNKYLFDVSADKLNDTLKRIFKHPDVNISYFRISYESCRYVDAIISGNMNEFLQNCYQLRHSPTVILESYILNINKIPKLVTKLQNHFNGVKINSVAEIKKEITEKANEQVDIALLKREKERLRKKIYRSNFY